MLIEFSKMERSNFLVKVSSKGNMLCVNHPFEIIFGVISMCIGLYMIPGYQLNQETNDFEMNSRLNTIIRFLSGLAIILKLKNLHQLTSKFVLFSSILVTLIPSFFLFNSLQNLFGHQKRFNLCSLVFICTLDSLCTILLMRLGYYSELYDVQITCQSISIAIVSNYLSFILMYPAALSLIYEFSRRKNLIKLETSHETTSDQALKNFANPVTINVKLVMIMFLALIHLKWLLRPLGQRSRNAIVDIDSLSNSNSTLLETIFFTSNDSTKNNHLLEISLIFTVSIYLLAKSGLYDFETNTNSEVNHLFAVRQTQKRVVLRTISESTRQQQQRSIEELKQIIRDNQKVDNLLNDEEILELIKTKDMPVYLLEKFLQNKSRVVQIRRKFYEKIKALESLKDIPHDDYNYEQVIGKCCENVVGYVPIPLGLAGPLLINGKSFLVPMATTEGTLVASTNRGCSALSRGKGVFTRILADGMTRGPVLRFKSALNAADAKDWFEKEENFIKIQKIFESTSKYAKLKTVRGALAGRLLYLRFVASTGDAMGMNMITKGVEKVLVYYSKNYCNDAEVLSLSGNYCTDKKSSSKNWTEGRGKSVVAEATIPADVVRSILKTTSKNLVELNVAKNLIGSAMAGSLGGFNAHAANLVSAIYIACGQDTAQVVEGSNCMTLMECCENDDLYVTCTMPCIEVGTVGGGTGLAAQAACLKILGVHGAHEIPGRNASELASVICAAVLAGELSLMSALSAGHLVNSHMQYNRGSQK